jgi:hypothetical protein
MYVNLLNIPTVRFGTLWGCHVKMDLSIHYGIDDSRKVQNSDSHLLNRGRPRNRPEAARRLDRAR